MDKGAEVDKRAEMGRIAKMGMTTKMGPIWGVLILQYQIAACVAPMNEKSRFLHSYV